MCGARFAKQRALVFTFATVGTLLAARMDAALKIPSDFKHWYLVHSTLVTKDNNTLA